MLKRIRKLLDRRKKPAEEVSVAEQAAERPPDRPEPAPSAAAERTRDRPNPPIHEGPRIVHRPIASADLDAEAVKIVRRLTRFDHQAYLVGGCVRDLLLERKPKDFDVGTSATPRQIKRLFRNCRVIGRRFRLAHIYFQDGKIIEVATFRARDGYDESGDEAVKDDLLIRDDNVFGTPEEDALRRDFTINALFYDVNDQTVLDHTDGLTDLRRRLVRTIGDPAIRFREDPIRVLRAIKFAARLDFEIEAATLAAISSTRGEIRRAASPRVLEEINRLCRGGAARRSFELLRSTGVLEVILPEVAAHARGRSWELLLALLERMDARTASAAGDVRTGTIFAGLLLPLVVGQAKGVGEARARLEPVAACALLDELLRSIALRLRVPRREQEYCRELWLAVVTRAAASDRPPSRRSNAAREVREDAVWFAEVLGAELPPALASDAAALASLAAPADDSEARTPRGRRRGRRGGRRRRRPDAAPVADGARPSEAEVARVAQRPRARPERPAEGKPLPPIWSDDYFFAALPTAPEEGSPLPPEAVGAVVVEPLESPSPVASADGRPRRRRPRRRRRKTATTRSAESAEAPQASEALERDEPVPDEDEE
jgi:poly(A) polymerase